MTHSLTTAEADTRQSKGSHRTSSVLTSVVFVGLAVFYFANALMLPSAESEGVGPKTFPIAIGAILLIASALGPSQY